MKKNYKIITSLAILIIVSVLIVLKTRSNRRSLAELTPAVKKGSIIESVYGIGTVTASRSFQLKLGVTSTVLKLYAKEGDSVRSGQRLIDLDGTGSFKAPFDGTITFLPSKTGETVFAQALILSLVDLNDLYLTVSLDQRGALRVRNSQKAKVSFDSMRGEVFDGVVQSIYSNDNNFFVRIGVTNLPKQVLPGMTGDVAIGITERKDVLLVSATAIENGIVRRIRDGSLKKIEIKTGIIDGAMAEVISGDLREGDQVVIRKKIEP